MNNDAFDVTWDLSAKPDVATTTLTATGGLYTPFLYSKIYKCKTWFNVVPFCKNPAGMKSYCGVGFGYGHLTSANDGLNATMLFIKQTGPDGAGDFECVLKARALQRFLTNKCMKERPETKDECFKDAAPTLEVAAAEPEAAPAVAAVEPEAAEDTEPVLLGNKVAMDIQKEADKGMAMAEMVELVPEPTYSIKVDIHSKTHHPSADKYKDFDKVLTNQLLVSEELDPAIYYKPELNSRVKEPIIFMLSKLEEDELFHKLAEEIAKNEAQQDTANQPGTFRYNSLSADTKMRKSRMKGDNNVNASKRNIQHYRDAIVSNNSSYDELIMWCRKLSKEHHTMPAMGPGIKSIGII